MHDPFSNLNLMLNIAEARANGLHYFAAALEAILRKQLGIPAS